MAEDKKKKVGNPGRRSSGRLARERLDVVERMLRQCWSHSRIKKSIAKEWGIGERQAGNYIKRVYDQWQKDADKLLYDRVELRRNQLEGILELAMNEEPPDKKTAVQCLDRLLKVEGGYAPVKVESTVTHNDLRKMTSHDKRTELERLMELYRPKKGNGVSGGNGVSKKNGTNGGHGPN
jgi:hypothetical protein